MNRHFLLALSPVDPRYVPEDRDDILRFLTETGLISSQWQAGRYRVGERFLSLLSFTGCSPFLNFEPNDHLTFCHIEIPPICENPEFRYHPHIPGPVCPVCRQKIEPWKDRDHVPLKTMACDQCDQVFPQDVVVWRQRLMCIARTSLFIWNIGEGEAVPATELLDGLKHLTGVVWRYSYIST